MNEPSPRSGGRSAWLAGALLVLTLIAYGPVTQAGYVWDDDSYLTDNPSITEPGGFGGIWVPGVTPQYYPAVFSMFWLEYRLWGLDPTGYHVVNALLHALGAVLAWRVFRRLGLPGAWFVAALFAVHPVHVESVAWITERKNVLSGVFYFAAALAYLRFDAAWSRTYDTPAAGRGKAWYAASLACFTLALLSKTVTCSLPAALILARLWMRRPVDVRRLAPLLPMFAIGVALALQTAHLERTHVGATGPDFAFTFAERVLIAGNALVFYAQKLVAPWPLVFIYPRWTLDAGNAFAYWPVAIVLGVGVIALIAFLRGVRGPFVALAFFAGTLFPALGFFNVYPMLYSFVADHFQYLASVGVIALAVGTMMRYVPRKVTVGIGSAVLVAFVALTWLQIRQYENETTLWETTVARNPSAWIGHNNLASVASEAGRHEEALSRLERAITLTDSAKAIARMRRNIAVSLTKLGRHEDALAAYRAVDASRGGVDLQIARTLERLRRDDDAEAAFHRALDGPHRSATLAPLALHYLRRGRAREAVPLLEERVRAAPDDANARMFLADAFAAAGNLRSAVATAEAAMAIFEARGDRRTVDLIRRRIAQYRGGRGGRR